MLTTPTSNLGQILERNASQSPDRPAVLHAGREITWAEVNERANRLADGFRAKGLKKGDRTAFLLRNGPHWIEVTFAALKIGAVLVPLSYRLAPRELERVVKDCCPFVLILDDVFLNTGRQLSFWSEQPNNVLLIGERHGRASNYEDLVRNSSDREIKSESDAGDLAYISFTSGTTGLPKGVMWKHGALLSTVVDNPFPREICRQSTQMVLAPSFVAGSQIQILNAAYHGATMILMDFDPAAVLRTIERERPTLLASAAVMLRMLSALPDAAQYDTSSLQRVYYGGSSMGSIQAFHKIRQVFPCEFQQGYGGAETCILVTRLEPGDHEGLEDPEKAGRLLSAGRPAQGARVKILGPDGKAEVPPGEVGEVAIRAPWLMEGYWNRPRETTRSFNEEGYYLTRDMARMDHDGYLYLVDRKDEMIKTGGLNVYPSEVETAIASHPSVEEAAVIGLPHPKWEKAVTAIVRIKKDAALSEDELQDFCRQSIGAYKVPKAVFFTSQPLPRNPLGKVEKKALKEAYSRKTRVEEMSVRQTKPRVPDPASDPLRHCRKCEFQEVCEKFCSKYFE